MTNIELENARHLYYTCLEGKKNLLGWIEYKPAHVFANQYLDINRDKIRKITTDEILRTSFLSIFSNTENSSSLLIYLNRIQRKTEKIDDEKPHLKSVNWEKCINIPEGLEHLSLTEEERENGVNIYSLYCDIETNKPVLYGDSTPNRFDNIDNIIILPDYEPKTEEYCYNSRSLERISKGSAKIYYERLQLYYFKQLLETSCEEALSRVKSLSKEDLRKICLEK